MHRKHIFGLITFPVTNSKMFTTSMPNKLKQPSHKLKVSSRMTDGRPVEVLGGAKLRKFSNFFGLKLPRNFDISTKKTDFPGQGPNSRTFQGFPGPFSDSRTGFQGFPGPWKNKLKKLKNRLGRAQKIQLQCTIFLHFTALPPLSIVFNPYIIQPEFLSTTEKNCGKSKKL